MNSFLVTYKLDNSTESYDDISSKLKNYPNWAKLFARTWIIRTSHSSKRVRDELADVIEGKGQIVVINITDSAWATYRINDTMLDWMKKECLKSILIFTFF
jgi:hypothetical protein